MLGIRLEISDLALLPALQIQILEKIGFISQKELQKFFAMLEKLEQKKKRLISELEKVIKEIAIQEDIQHQLQLGAGVGKKSRSNFEKKVRAKFRISNNQI